MSLKILRKTSALICAPVSSGIRAFTRSLVVVQVYFWILTYGKAATDVSFAQSLRARAGVANEQIHGRRILERGIRSTEGHAHSLAPSGSSLEVEQYWTDGHMSVRTHVDVETVEEKGRVKAH